MKEMGGAGQREERGGVMGGQGVVKWRRAVWLGRGKAELQTRADLGEMGSHGRRSERARAVWSGVEPRGNRPAGLSLLHT